MSVAENFLKYISFDTKSDENCDSIPSTQGQLVLGEFLVGELSRVGMQNAHMDENGYVYGFLPASKGMEEKPAIGFIAHMDTSPDVSGKDVCTEVIDYKGGDIVHKNGLVTSLKDFDFLENFIGQHLIITGGDTLLGSDDKAGIAEIISAMEYLTNHTELAHPKISVAFTPDEEIGSGADLLDLDKFGADYGYTIDGGFLGELEYENFNAAGAKIVVKGVNIHPGSAKNKMKNAVLMANEFISMMPKAETPAHTEGYEGFYHVAEFSGDESSAEFSMIIRDHDMEKFLARKEFIVNLTAYLNGVYGEGSFTAFIKDSYYNMKEKVLPFPHIIENAKAAMESVGVMPKVVAIRGGTDGARLSFRGLPCPNLSTGGMNFHSVHEMVSVEAMEKMVEVIVAIATK